MRCFVMAGWTRFLFASQRCYASLSSSATSSSRCFISVDGGTTSVSRSLLALTLACSRSLFLLLFSFSFSCWLALSSLPRSLTRSLSVTPYIHPHPHCISALSFSLSHLSALTLTLAPQRILGTPHPQTSTVIAFAMLDPGLCFPLPGCARSPAVFNGCARVWSAVLRCSRGR